MSKDQYASVNHLFRSFRRVLLSGELQVFQRRIINGSPSQLGEVELEESNIFIKRGLPPNVKLETLIHELLHYDYQKVSEEEIERLTPLVYGQLGQNRRGFLQSFLTEESM